MKTRILAVLKKIDTLFYVYLFLLAVCLVVKLIFSREQIFFAFNGWHFVFGDAIAIYFTDMGDGLFVLALSAAIVIFNYRTAFLLCSSYLLTSLVAQIAKHIFVMPRPSAYFKDELSRINFVKGVEVFSSNSFPSGHTVTAFSAAVVLTYLIPKKGWGFVFLLWAILIGYSRIYLCEHFFEDVVGGSVIGVCITVPWLAYIDDLPFLHSQGWKCGGLIDLLKRI